MSEAAILAAEDPLWPMPPSMRLLWRVGLTALPAVARAGRALPPLRLGERLFVALRHDDAREVMRSDGAFAAPYEPRLRVITGGEPFLLGLRDGPEYREAHTALRSLLLLPQDPVALAAAAGEGVEARLPAAGGALDAVPAFRAATFDAFARWFGLPEPGGVPGRLAVWATRLFGYHFGGGGTAPEPEAAALAEALRAHVGTQVHRRRAGGGTGASLPGAQPDLLDRALLRQAAGEAWFTDAAIRTAVVCLAVGGPPQPPMAAAHALAHMLKRPAALRAARSAARAGDEAALRRVALEALRFDPITPAIERVAAAPHILAAGTPRARAVPVGATVLVAPGSAMRDPRRVGEPERFDPDRPAVAGLHFGLGLHACFGREMAEAMLPALLAPVLRRPGLRATGGLRKRGAHAESLPLAL